MNAMADVESFISSGKIAILGVSRTGKRFGAAVMKELIANNYEVFPVNPFAEEINGVRCYKSINELPGDVGAALIALKPAQTDNAVKEAVGKGIKNIWLQQGSSTKTAVEYCRSNGVSLIDNECILMFAGASGFHSFHKWLWKVFGKLPK